MRFAAPRNRSADAADNRTMSRRCLLLALALALGCSSALSDKVALPKRPDRSAPARLVPSPTRCGPYSCPPPKGGQAPASRRPNSVPFPTCGNGSAGEAPRGAL